MTEYGLVDGPAPVNGQPQTKMADILAEIIASVELSRLSDFHSDESLPAAPSFVTVEKVELVRGLYPQALLQLWDQVDSLAIPVIGATRNISKGWKCNTILNASGWKNYQLQH